MRLPGHGHPFAHAQRLASSLHQARPFCPIPATLSASHALARPFAHPGQDKAQNGLLHLPAWPHEHRKGASTEKGQASSPAPLLPPAGASLSPATLPPVHPPTALPPAPGTPYMLAVPSPAAPQSSCTFHPPSCCTAPRLAHLPPCPLLNLAFSFSSVCLSKVLPCSLSFPVLSTIQKSPVFGKCPENVDFLRFNKARLYI